MRDRDGGRNLLLTPFLFIFRRVLQLVVVVRLGLVTLVPMLSFVRIIGILVRIIWRTVAHSVVITASEHSSS